MDVNFNELKITSRYFQGGSNSARNESMVAIVRSIGKVMHIPVVATQIETDAMESRAIASGIEYLQGHRISVPLLADAAEGWLRNGKAIDAFPSRSIGGHALSGPEVTGR